MLNQVVLIIDSRKEMSTKYKRVIEQNNAINALITTDISDALLYVENLEPDLILISDSLDEKPSELCQKIRRMSISFRPVIIVLSKSSHIDDKLEALNSGADDFLSEPIDLIEFSARINAQFRRQRESLVLSHSGLPFSEAVYKILRRSIKSAEPWALLEININNLDDYAQIYGDIAEEKMIQTFCAILKSALDSNDFLGETTKNNFMIITSPLKADKIANFVNFAFDMVASKFYNETDKKRGYIIVSGDERADRRVPIVTTSIGVIDNNHKTYVDYKEAINAVRNIHKLSKSRPGSSFIIDRPQLSGEDSVLNVVNNKILIMETDDALGYLLETTAKMQGYNAQTFSEYDDLVDKIREFEPALLILDTGDAASQKGFDICREIKNNIEFSSLKIIMTTIVHDKEQVLNTGADLYLPKPYDLVSLYRWVEKLLSDY